MSNTLSFLLLISLLLLISPITCEIISLSSSTSFIPIFPSPSFEGFGTLLRKQGQIDWTKVEFRQDCGGVQGTCSQDVEIFTATFPLPLECYTSNCDVSEHGLSQGELCDGNLKPITTNDDVIIDSFTLKTSSGFFPSPTTVPTSWYYASILIICDPSSSVFASGDIYVIDPQNDLLLGVFTGVVPCYAVLTAIAGATFLGLIGLIFTNNKKDILLLHYQFVLIIPCVTISYALNAAMYGSYMSTGLRQGELGVAKIVFSVAGKTAVRTLALPLCLGLGISTPTLSKRSWLVITAIGVGYAVAEGAYEILDSTSKPVDEWSDNYQNWTMVLNFVSTALNVLLWVYSWEGLNRTIAKLVDERQHHKVKRFKTFKRFLVLLLTFAVFMTLLGLALWAKPWLSGLFLGWFIQEGWSEFAYLTLMVVIVVVWRPVSRLGEL
eukprot:CAMPEP_0118651312 /NCGR_PEP_ID=MMETSP0785-20121206/10722_1 /TAXON_ID=91992 /ORGANISM="Bolidomonas pacifica, Strain CCMP 1866" /LENGTH=436 /DNA_ID=CAMNT_0006543763 /DNA_START=91 /DNA_END=1397 /DNA_ORIENTATION=-